MNVDCQWIQENQEALTFERLSPEDDHRARMHLESCKQCREKLEDLRIVDPMIKQLFRQNLAIARTPQKRRSPVLIGAFGTGFAAIIILIVISTMSRPVSNVPRLESPPAVASIPTSTPDSANIPKVGDSNVQDRAKPEVGAPDQPSANAAKTSGDKAPDFLVTDPAGYSRTLNDYRDHILIFGVWTAAEPRTVTNLQKIYETFSRNTQLRILGVAIDKQSKPRAATFPIAYNQGSTLLGARSSEFLIVDGKGVLRFRGSLLDSQSNVVNSIRTDLSQLGIR
jgi:hypothetical protein